MDLYRRTPQIKNVGSACWCWFVGAGVDFDAVESVALFLTRITGGIRYSLYVTTAPVCRLDRPALFHALHAISPLLWDSYAEGFAACWCVQGGELMALTYTEIVHGRSR